MHVEVIPPTAVDLHHRYVNGAAASLLLSGQAVFLLVDERWRRRPYCLLLHCCCAAGLGVCAHNKVSDSRSVTASQCDVPRPSRAEFGRVYIKHPGLGMGLTFPCSSESKQKKQNFPIKKGSIGLIYLIQFKIFWGSVLVLRNDILAFFSEHNSSQQSYQCISCLTF